MNLCDAKEIPYIDVNLDPDTKPPVINVHPHPEAIAQVFVDLVNASNWQGFTVIYETGNLKWIAVWISANCGEQFSSMGSKGGKTSAILWSRNIHNNIEAN